MAANPGEVVKQSLGVPQNGHDVKLKSLTAALCKPNRAAKFRLKPTFLLLKSFPA